MPIILPGVVEATLPYTVVRNSNLSPQALTAATEAIITGATVKVPDTGLVPGALYRIKLFIDKTAAGIATSAYRIGLVYGDAAAVSVANVNTLLTFTKPAGTAAADVGIVEIALAVLVVGSNAAEQGSVSGQFVMDHNLAATGHLTIPTSVQSAVDTSTATILNQAKSGGGSLVLTITTGAADVSSVLYAEGELLVPPAT